ncbi:alpha/beta hydrolase [Thermosynechococcaceae cyanobacterium BACA0444]|uniref:Alpha/beta hydrolase n=1 Tax=Pseudocalidococcus azoricus BACA0444 TaxID=2918990 RepID=A0AAE4FTA8_9CYAN|nr:alpha/beta hydrolase [Pseudocalidococcus azoricus]MDS3861949.1 alpha/beta hydrolase [Pseudocalidococcus azoricus BACA0444]
MSDVVVRGVSHYYQWICQDASASSEHPKPVMVFLHGWGGSSAYWQTTATALAPDFDCLLYDLRGFGQSQSAPKDQDNPQAYNLPSYVTDLKEFLDGLGLEKVYLNAHSTGASIAALFLSQYPDRVYQAILTCSGIFTYEPLPFALFHLMGGYVVQFRPRWLSQIPGVARLFMSRFLDRPIPQAWQQEFLEDFLQANATAALGLMYSAVSEWAAIQIPQAFARIQTPTLLISGEFDQIIPAPLGQTAAQLNPRVKQIVIPKTGHFPMLEDAATYLAVVNNFLKVPQPHP